MTLIDRLSKLDGPDREVEKEIHDLLCHGKYFSQLADAPLGNGCWIYNFQNGDVSSALRITSSVDAAIALAERVLPGWKRQLLEDFNGKWIARICSQRRELFSTDYLRETELGGSPNPAIALCIAILRAKEASNGIR